MQRQKISAKANQFTESVIREMTRVALQHSAVNLAQGFPDFPCPQELKQAAYEAIEADVNQYAITWGDRPFREAIANKVQWYLGLDINPETQITLTCGSTEAMAAVMLATVDPGSSFFSQPQKGYLLIRFCFSKRPETLQTASDRLLKLQATLQLKQL
ncbi:MAG: aminotransferase class I/II-fold pyridoxal phosphate-dependent enzyme [Nostoc sp.]